MRHGLLRKCANATRNHAGISLEAECVGHVEVVSILFLWTTWKSFESIRFSPTSGLMNGFGVPCRSVYKLVAPAVASSPHGPGGQPYNEIATPNLPIMRVVVV